MLSFILRSSIAMALLGGWLGGFGLVTAEDWPMFGRDGSRNAVSSERGAPTWWSVEERDESGAMRGMRGIRWSAALGTETHSTPVVSGGLVWIGTNDQRPGVQSGLNSVLKCFRVADGKQVYEYVSPKFGTRIQDAGWTGLGSSPLIEGDRLWLTTNRSEVVCWDIGPVIRGEGTPRELWKVDLIKTFDTFPHVPLMGPARPCSIGASWKGRIFVTTNNGVDEGRVNVPKPDAANVVCLDQKTGEVYWKDSSPGSNILLTQLASPTVATIRGQAQVIVPQSDGWVRAFDPESGQKLWEFDINAKVSVHHLGGRSTRNGLLGNAVVYEDRVFVASGRDVEHGEGPGRLVCIDPTKRGDVSSELAVDADGKLLPRRRIQAVKVDAGEKAIPNPNSALVWEFGTNGKKFEDSMHGTMNSVAVAKGLVIAPDRAGMVHCLDAKTGKRYWAFDSLSTFWSAPLIVEDKVYVPDEDGEMAIFGLSADPDVALRKVDGKLQPIAEISLENMVCSSPIFAGGVLYVATRNRLFAIVGDKNQPDPKSASGSWPQWRGPNRDNVSLEKGLLKEWPVEGPPLAWRVDGLGDGIASVSIADGRIYTLGYFDDGEFLTALDQHTAQRAWATRLGPKVNENPLMRWLSQRSPTVDDDRIYAITTNGRLVCLQTRDGRELWSKDYLEAFGAKRPGFGFCDYPLVDGDKLICAPGSADAAVVALDKRTGKEIWRFVAPDAGRSAYAAMMVTEVGGVRQYVAFLSQALLGVRATDGQLLWSYKKVLGPAANSHTPMVHGDRILVSNGYGSGIASLKLVANGDKVDAQEQYFERSNLDAFQDNALLVGEHIFDSGGSGSVVCLESKTGQKAWDSIRLKGAGRVAMIFADERLYVRQSEGRVTLFDVSTKAFVERGSFDIPNAVRAAGATFPVIAGGRLFLRDENKLLCYDIREAALNQSPAKPQLITLDAPKATAIPASEPRERTLRSVFVPTPQDVVDKMLELADVKKSDVVYDLGSGDGRIVITAAKKFGCKAVGYELDKDLVELSRTKAEADGVKSLVTIEAKDLFTADLSDANVIAVYLLPQQLEKLLPQLQKLKPGVRIVSHYFSLPDVPPDRTLTIRSAEDNNEHTIKLWTTPLRVTQGTD